MLCEERTLYNLSCVFDTFFSFDFQPREKGRMRFHMLHNVQMALDFLRFKKVSAYYVKLLRIFSFHLGCTLGRNDDEDYCIWRFFCIFMRIYINERIIFSIWYYNFLSKWTLVFFLDVQ